LDFAFVVTFIGILVPLLTNQPAIVCALAAGAGALLFHALPHQLGLIVATLMGVAAGVGASGWRRAEKQIEVQDRRMG
jgi:predicted branched-subunit amino acid permease